MATLQSHETIRSLTPYLHLVCSAALLYYVSSTLYNAFLGPLSKFPGPILNSLSKIPNTLDGIAGKNASTLRSLHEKYGPVVRVAPKQLSYQGDLQTWEDIFGHRKGGAVKPHKDSDFYVTPPNGAHHVISTPLDAEHGRQRKILSHAFSDKALREQEVILKGWVNKLLVKLSEQHSTNEPIDLLKYYNCTTFDVMGDLTFGENLHMLDSGELNPWVHTIFGQLKNNMIIEAVGRLHPWSMWLTQNVLKKIPAVAHEEHKHLTYTRERLERRLARNTDRPDFWTKILAKSETEGGLTFEEQDSNASVFMIAGTETTATALSGTTYQLLRNPDAMQKLCQEIRETFSSFDDVTLEKVTPLPYLNAVLKEGLRMYPPVPTGQQRTVPPSGSTIQGQYVPPGTNVSIQHLATYTSEAFFAKSNEFHPERWLDDASAEFKGDQQDSLQPFSFGPRNCIGKNLAWLEMRLILTAVLLCYDLKLMPESEKWNEQNVWILWEKHPLMCKLTPAGQ